MTRLEKQINDSLQKHNELVRFSREQMKKYLDDRDVIIGVFKTYKIKGFDDSNSFVDYGVVDESEMTFKMYIKADWSHLSNRQLKYLENKLRELGVPVSRMPFIAGSLYLYYR